MVEIKLVNHHEKRKELLDLFRASFGHDMSVERWDWQFSHNPLASDIPDFCVAMHDNRIVGVRPYIPSRMWLGNEKIKAAQGVNAMVHAEYQGQGIFPRMIHPARDYLVSKDYTVNYGFPNYRLQPVVLGEGARIVSPLEDLFAAVNPRKVLSHKLDNRLLGNTLGFFYSRLLNAKVRKPPPPPNSFHIGVFDQFNDELSGVDNLRDESRIDLMRDEAYLRWRFDQHPEYQHRYVISKRDGQLLGYAVIYARTSDDGLVWGRIVDHLVKNDDSECARSIIAACVRELRAMESDFIDIRVFDNPALRRELIHHFGFRSLRTFPYERIVNRFNFVVRALDERVLEKADIYDKGNWRVTHAHCDVE
jgi:GNAT superfamily N-acetyltransferase